MIQKNMYVSILSHLMVFCFGILPNRLTRYKIDFEINIDPSNQIHISKIIKCIHLYLLVLLLARTTFWSRIRGAKTWRSGVRLELLDARFGDGNQTIRDQLQSLNSTGIGLKAISVNEIVIEQMRKDPRRFSFIVTAGTLYLAGLAVRLPNGTYELNHIRPTHIVERGGGCGSITPGAASVVASDAGGGPGADPSDMSIDCQVPETPGIFMCTRDGEVAP